MEKHHHNHKHAGSRLLLAILLNGLITLVEIAGGILSNSLALISDAIHNLSDTLALILAWLAGKAGARKPDQKRTYGYIRFEILSAFINASVLTVISLYLIYEALQRFLHPEPVRPVLMLIVASIGLAANLASVLFLHRDSKNSLNVKAAYIHLLGDTLSSVAVIAGGLLMYFTGFLWVDPLLTMIISTVIMVQAYQILRESVEILMQSTPREIDLSEIKTLLEKHPLIQNIHHVHCWQLQDHDIHFEAHIETTRDMPLSESCKLVSEVERQLEEKYHIHHTTLQIEFEVCGDKEMIRQPG
ncbi:MAG: cation diffusion facilitator family transporter [Bacteroidetes bacterium]|nr:cation diffusion facilitator family transporter [Bacteroidota bacterium]